MVLFLAFSNFGENQESLKTSKNFKTGWKIFNLGKNIGLLTLAKISKLRHQEEPFGNYVAIQKIQHLSTI